MAEKQAISNWNPLDYLSLEELARLDEGFDHTLQDAECLVFWTGLSLELARQWAAPRGLQTLKMALGPLYSDRGVGSTRHGKSPKGWPKYMKGASGRFAEYACQTNRRVIILTKPPPKIYGMREISNYQHLEEPILKGVLVAPAWPLSKSSEWDIFRETLVPQRPASSDISGGSAKCVALVEEGRVCEVVVEIVQGDRNQQNKANIAERENKIEDKHQAQERKKEAKRMKAEPKQQEIERKKDARLEEAETKKQRKAQEMNNANQKKVDVNQLLAQEKKEPNKIKGKLEQRLAQEKKEANGMKTAVDRQNSLVRNERI